MFETIPVDIRTSARHGGFVLLDSYRYEHGDLTVCLFAPGTGDTGEMRFTDVIGFTMKEDVFGSDGGQITREDVANGRDDAAEPDRARVAGFFSRTSASPTVRAVRAAVAAPFNDTVENHQHYRLSLREYELSFVAGPDYEIEVVPADGPAT